MKLWQTLKKPFFYLQWRVFIIILGLAFLILSVSGASIILLLNRSDQMLNQEMIMRLKASSNSIEDELKTVEEISFQIFSNKTIQQQLSEINDYPNLETDRYLMRQYRNTIEETLLTYLYQKSYFDEIVLLDNMENAYVVQRSSTPSGITATGRITDNRAAIDERGRVVWIADAPYLLLLRQVRRVEGLALDPIGVIAVLLNMERFERGTGLSLESRQFFILDDNQNPVNGDMPQWLATLSYAGDSGHQFYQHGSNRYLLFHQRSTESNLLYVDVMDLTETQSTRSLMIRASALLILLMFVVVVFASSALSKAVTQPISQLIGNISSEDHLDLERYVQEQASKGTRSEVDILYNDFLLMLQRIDALNKADYEQRREIDRTTFMALQAQINPHFLYNTLDTMNWIARENDQVMISRMLEALSDYLRYITRINETTVTLQRELEATESYLVIEKTRFEEQLQYTFDIDDSLRSMQMPKMILQPVIENSIKHVLEKTPAVCVITTTARAMGDCAVIAIHDNGPGMTQEAIATALAVRKGDGYRRSIGLYNIAQRLRQRYHREGLLRIESEPGHGTTVLLTIPFETEGEREESP